MAEKFKSTCGNYWGLLQTAEHLFRLQIVYLRTMTSSQEADHMPSLMPPFKETKQEVRSAQRRGSASSGTRSAGNAERQLLNGKQCAEQCAQGCVEAVLSCSETDVLSCWCTVADAEWFEPFADTVPAANILLWSSYKPVNLSPDNRVDCIFSQRYWIF